MMGPSRAGGFVGSVFTPVPRRAYVRRYEICSSARRQFDGSARAADGVVRVVRSRCGLPGVVLPNVRARVRVRVRPRLKSGARAPTVGVRRARARLRLESDAHARARAVHERGQCGR